MHALIYVSKAQRPFDEEELTELAHAFAIENAEAGITGYLFYKNGQFCQYIEGESAQVETLIARIRRDERHRVLRVYQQADIESRRFPHWAMTYLSDDTDSIIHLENILLKHFDRIARSIGNEENWEALIWRCVDRLAGLTSFFTSSLGRRHLLDLNKEKLSQGDDLLEIFAGKPVQGHHK